MAISNSPDRGTDKAQVTVESYTANILASSESEKGEMADITKQTLDKAGIDIGLVYYDVVGGPNPNDSSPDGVIKAVIAIQNGLKFPLVRSRNGVDGILGRNTLRAYNSMVKHRDKVEAKRGRMKKAQEAHSKRAELSSKVDSVDADVMLAKSVLDDADNRYVAAIEADTDGSTDATRAEIKAAHDDIVAAKRAVAKAEKLKLDVEMIPYKEAVAKAQVRLDQAVAKLDEAQNKDPKFVTDREAYLSPLRRELGKATDDLIAAQMALNDAPVQIAKAHERSKTVAKAVDKAVASVDAAVANAGKAVPKLNWDGGTDVASK